MILSHKHRFIFLKTKKTAGTSLELALCQICGPGDIITPIMEADERIRKGLGPQNWRRHSWFRSPRSLWKRRWFKVGPADYGYYGHMTAKEIASFIGPEIWNSYFKFAFDRNPWDRQVSHYHFRYRRSARPPSFAEFLDRDRRARLYNYEIYSLDGSPAVDFLGRFENLTADLANVLQTLGIDQEIELPRAKSSFRPARPYRDYYDDRTSALVADWYQSEIKLLGYCF
jgi:hypothetical protein